jgi:WD40-like Beta Propeller Repeat
VLGSRAMRNWALGICWLFAISGCGGSDSGGAASATGGSAGAAGAAGSGGGQLIDSGTDGTVEDAGSDAITEGGVPEPQPDDIGFAADNPIPSGEQILFNDWSPQPNLVLSIHPDGTGETPIFSAYRVWSMGVSHDTNTIAFACGDPLQEDHYALTLGDAIQNTWLYDVGAQTASVLSYGNINDECHTFSADDAHLYVCRRYDFMADNTNHTYRLGRLDSATGAFEYLGPDLPNELELHPQPTADESTVYYTIVEVAGGKQTRRIVKKALPNGAPEVVRLDASSGVLSPDGTQMVFADTAQQSQLFVMNVDGSGVIKVATHPGTNAAWSPDGTKIAFLWSETSGCNHIETVAADGSQADAPFRVRDCGAAFVTDLAWIDRP